MLITFSQLFQILKIVFATQILIRKSCIVLYDIVFKFFPIAYFSRSNPFLN